MNYPVKPDNDDLLMDGGDLINHYPLWDYDCSREFPFELTKGFLGVEAGIEPAYFYFKIWWLIEQLRK